MFFNQELRVGLTAGFVSLAFAVTGCSHMHGRARPAQAAQAAAPVASQAPATVADQTATEAAVSHGDESASSAAPAPASADQSNGADAAGKTALTRDAINPGAPMR